MPEITKDTATDAALAVRERKAEARRVGEAFGRPFHPNAIKWKPQTVKGNRAMAMAYIDARLIQDRLDEVVGVGGWQDEYAIVDGGSVVCQLRVRVGDEWITKTDVGSPSEQPDGGDRMKAAFSDALKRAAVKFGIGRYLYRLAAQWVDYDPVKKRITQVPTLPAFAVPAQAAEYEVLPDEPEPPTPDDPRLRGETATLIAQAKSREDLSRLWKAYEAHLAGGRLGAGDKAALEPLFQAAAAKFPRAEAKKS